MTPQIQKIAAGASPLTREAWLELATVKLREGLFKRVGETVPVVRVSVGFPGGGSARKRIGEYWHARATTDQVPQVFISPVLSDAVQVLDVLVHELVHAVTPGDGHKAQFKRVALAVGLTGKMTATVAGPALKAELEAMLAEIGPYPHGAINLQDRKKQTTRLLKAECQDCGYTVRVTRKWVEEAGTPLCPCNGASMEVKSEGSAA
jgi:hypothetical protein